MNFFFLNEDLKDVEINLDRQLSLSKAMADHLKIKYDDILHTANRNKSMSIDTILSDDMKIDQEPDLEESRSKIKRIIHPKE